MFPTVKFESHQIVPKSVPEQNMFVLGSTNEVRATECTREYAIYERIVFLFEEKNIHAIYQAPTTRRRVAK